MTDTTSLLTPLELEYWEAARAGNGAEVHRLAPLVEAADQAKETRLNAPGALLSAALWYARQGIKVFPCRAGQKRPATLSGFYDATTDETKIREWWTREPAYNIGAPTGYLFDVLDVDGTPGYQSLAILRGADKVPPLIGKARTPHGVHLYVTTTGQGNTAGIAPGLDFRGDGGYVVIPPSRLDDGGTYRWAIPLQTEATK